MILELKRLLKHLEQVLDPVRQNKITELYKKALNWESAPRLPLVLSYPLPQDFHFKPYPTSQILDNPEKMLYNELVYAFNASIACRDRLDDDVPCIIRANFGTVIIASMFGGKIEQIGENPPWIRPFENDKEFEKVLDCDPLDFSKGWCSKVTGTYKVYRQILSNLPTLQKSIKVVLPDLQGPFDSASLLRGSRIYEDFYNNEDMLHKVISHIGKAQVGFAKHLQLYLNDGPKGYSHQHMSMIRGHILLRDDCSINVSPRLYHEHIAPHDTFVLGEMGSGGVHCCGNFEHLVEELLILPSIKCIDLGQPEMNNVDAIYKKAQQYKIPLIRVQANEDELTSGHIVNRFPTGVTLVHHTDSFEKARYIMETYKKAAEGSIDT